MQEEFLKYISQESLFQPGDKILLAVSGGVDSSVMAELFHRSGFTFGIAHCNFQLRAEESLRDEHFVRQMAERYHVPCFVRTFETRSYARKNKISIQMAARDLRYGWFEELLDGEGYDFVANAHQLDDQIETFFINLARGTGIAGLHGILPKQGRIIRPLLFADRSEIEKYALENHLPYVEDSSNTSLKYARNRIRHRIIPEFIKLNSAFREAMTETIHKIRDAEILLNSITEKERKRLLIRDGTGWKVEISDLKQLWPARTWLYMLISGFGFNSSVANDILASLDEQPGKIFYSSTHRIVKDRDYLLIHPLAEFDYSRTIRVYPDSQRDLPLNLEFKELDNINIGIKGSEDTVFLDYDRLQFPLTIRKWRRGDFFYPFGMNQKKKLSDFFIDMKFSLIQKEDTWLLCSGEDIVWVIGIRPDNRFRVNDSTRKILQVLLVR